MMNKYYLAFDQIEELDIELTNVCNLKCPLCLSQNSEFKNIFNPHNIDLNLIISRIEKFKNIDNILLCGDASEPTLYPQIIELLEYLKSRKNIHVELFTNGNTHDEKWWNKLNTHFNENSFICFTIAGIYKYSNAIYRIGSDLNKILNNIKAFNSGNKFKNTHLQYIRFEYNKHEKTEDVLNVLKQFPTYEIINTDPICERFKKKELENKGICCDKIFQLKYEQKLKQIKKNKPINIFCHNYNKRLIKMDPFGNIYPCILWRLYSNKQQFEYDGYLDYSSIFNNKHVYCYECDVELIKFLKENKRDQIFMC